MTSRFDRQIRFFGMEGQEKLASSRVAVVGIGGLGTHVVQQLALLGVGAFLLIDAEELDHTNLNRYVGARHDDPIPGTPKVDIGERLVKAINTHADVEKIMMPLLSREAFSRLRDVDTVFGCLDNEGGRLVLTEYCSAFEKPYFDLSSGIEENHASYGGTVCVAWDGRGCLVCRRELDMAEAHRDLMDPATRRNLDAIYGVPGDLLGVVGPSVVSINGVVASMGVTEFLLGVTGVRDPIGLARYRADTGKVTVATDPPVSDCYYCYGIRGKRERAKVERLLPTKSDD